MQGCLDFSNTLHGDYNSSPNDTLATRGPWVLRHLLTAKPMTLAGGPQADYQTDRIPTLIFMQRMDHK